MKEKIARVIYAPYLFIFTVKPEIQTYIRQYHFKKGMIINCTLKNPHEVNPPNVSYTWFLCDTGCDVDRAKLIVNSSSLQLTSHSRAAMEYRCIAKNAAGSDSKIIKVIDSRSKSTDY